MVAGNGHRDTKNALLIEMDEFLECLRISRQDPIKHRQIRVCTWLKLREFCLADLSVHPPSSPFESKRLSLVVAPPSLRSSSMGYPGREKRFKLRLSNSWALENPHE